MDELLTPKEAAAYLRLSTYTVKEYARRGVLPAAKVGGVWRFSRDALSRWLADRTVSAGASRETTLVRDALKTGIGDQAYRARPGFHLILARRHAASDAIDAIRLRSKSGDLQELLDENREELRRRSEKAEE